MRIIGYGIFKFEQSPLISNICWSVGSSSELHAQKVDRKDKKDMKVHRPK